MKGKPKSYLSCIPDVVSYDIEPTKDDFILLSTDGIFQSMSITEIVASFLYRPTSSNRNTVDSKLKKVQIRSSVA